METTFNSLYFSFSSKWKKMQQHDDMSTGRRLIVLGALNFRNEPMANS
jgi:hypothetical protein